MLKEMNIDGDGMVSWLHTCRRSAGVEKRAVTPLMMEEKEIEPTPYLEEDIW